MIRTDEPYNRVHARKRPPLPSWRFFSRGFCLYRNGALLHWVIQHSAMIPFQNRREDAVGVVGVVVVSVAVAVDITEVRAVAIVRRAQPPVTATGLSIYITPFRTLTGIPGHAILFLQFFIHSFKNALYPFLIRSASCL